MLALASSIIVSSLLSTALEPVNREIARILNKALQSEPLSLSDALVAYRRGVITYEELKDVASMNGFNESNLNKLIEVTTPILTIADAIDLYRKGVISEDEYVNLLKANGVDDKKRKYFELATKVYPSISDLIRFSVREVFNSDIVRKFRYDEDLPPRFIEEMKKLGMDEEYAKMYWYAHWELPSISLAMEMFHRGIITEDEFKELLKLHDISPHWRDKIVEVLYKLPTRVDLRRMYRIGVVDEEYVYNMYRKLGYDTDTAKALTKFTILTESEDEKSLSKSEILNMLEEGVIDEDKALTLLMGIGYSESSSKLIIATKKVEIRRKQLKDNIEEVKTKLINDEIDESTANDILIQLGLSESRVTKLLNDFRREKNRNVKLLTKEEYIKAFKDKIITLEELEVYLKKLGFNDEHIKIIFALNKIKVE